MAWMGLRSIYLIGNYDFDLVTYVPREKHYMRPEMLQSQFVTLEEPENAFVLDISEFARKYD